MRKPRDYDSELQALSDKAKLLKDRKVRQLGELVIATGADDLDPETLTGALLAITETKNANEQEAWRTRGAAFFRRPSSRKAPRTSPANTARDQKGTGDGVSR